MNWFPLAMRPVFVACARLLIALVVLGSHASAQNANPGLGRLTQFLPETGSDDSWRFVNGNNSFEIQNLGKPNAITYFYVQPEKDTEGHRTIEAVLNIHPESKGSAGLIYGLDRDRGVYHMLTLDAAGAVRLFRRDNNGFRPMLEVTSSAYEPEKLNKLRIVEKGNEISYLLNGAPLGSVSGDLYGFGGVGIGAIGDVRAFYTSFSDTADKDRTDLNLPRDTPETRPATTPGDALELRPVQIMDSNGPAGRPVPAYQTLIPVDWKTEGGVQWNMNDGTGRCFTGARLIWHAASPDGGYSLSFLEPISWGVTTSGPARYSCLQQDLTDAEAVMRAYLQALGPIFQSQNIIIQSMDFQRPAELRPLVEAFAQNWNTTVPGGQAWTDGIMLKTRFTDNGKPTESLTFAVTKHLSFSSTSGGFRNGYSGLILVMATPEGKLQEGHPAFGAILNNLRANPQWLNLESQWWQQKKAALSGQISGQIAANSSSGKSIGDSMFESWKRRQNMVDAGQRKSVNGIWEVQPWKAPGGNTVLLNQNYNHAWQLQNGSIVMTNDANFNPMQTFNQTGQQLQPGF